MSPPKDFLALRQHAEALARRLVDQHGVSTPFAVVMHHDGTMRTIGVQSRTETSPRLRELLGGLVETLRKPEARTGYRAVAVCVHGYVTLPDTGERADAILLNMESREGTAHAVAIPHVKGLFDSVCYHPPMEQPGRVLVFSSGRS